MRRRFWFRFTTTKRAARLGIPPPEFFPRLPAWDEWLWSHHRKQGQARALFPRDTRSSAPHARTLAKRAYRM